MSGPLRKGFFRILLLVTGLLIGGAPARGNDRISIAIAYFENTSGLAEVEMLKKGLAEMLITDLSVSNDIQLVERARLNDVLGELNLQDSEFFDPAKAAKLGAGLGAAYILTGSYLVVDQQIRIDARMIDVETSEVGLAVKVEGPSSDFMALERSLAEQLLDGLGASISMIQKKRLGAKGTKSVEALSAFSNALDAMDDGDTEAAQEAVGAAMQIDPDFVAAQALKERINEMAQQLDKNNLLEFAKRYIVFRRSIQCAESIENTEYFAKEDRFRALEYGEKLMRYRIQVGRQLLSGEQAPNALLQIPVDMLKIGHFQDANAFLNALVTGSTADKLSSDKECLVYQLSSYSRYLQTDFEEAMKWQLKSSEMPAFPGKDACLGGDWISQYQITGFRGPLSEQIIRSANPSDLARLKQRQSAFHRVHAELKEEIANVPEINCRKLNAWQCDNNRISNVPAWCTEFKELTGPLKVSGRSPQVVSQVKAASEGVDKSTTAGTDAWDERMKSILLDHFDLDKSGSIEGEKEVLLMTCDVWRELDRDRIEGENPYGILPFYGIAPDIPRAPWFGQALGFSGLSRSEIWESARQCLPNFQPEIARIAYLPFTLGTIEYEGFASLDEHVKTVIVDGFDVNGSGTIDTAGEVKAIPCDVWKEIDKKNMVCSGMTWEQCVSGGRNRYWERYSGLNMMTAFGFDPDGEGKWYGGNLGLDAKVRKSAFIEGGKCLAPP